MLEAAGGVASSGGTWAKVVHRVLEEEHCAALIDSVNVKGNECADSSFFFFSVFFLVIMQTTLLTPSGADIATDVAVRACTRCSWTI